MFDLTTDYTGMLNIALCYKKYSHLFPSANNILFLSKHLHKLTEAVALGMIFPFFASWQGNNPKKKKSEY